MLSQSREYKIKIFVEEFDKWIRTNPDQKYLIEKEKKLREIINGDKEMEDFFGNNYLVIMAFYKKYGINKIVEEKLNIVKEKINKNGCMLNIKMEVLTAYENPPKSKEIG